MKTLKRQFIKQISLAMAAPALTLKAWAQAWPTKPVRFICGFPPGGATDVIARTYAELMSRTLGKQFIVENKTGAGGGLAAVELSKAAPDGYTLMVTISTTLLQNRVLFKELGYDADKDFVLFGVQPTAGLILYVNPKLGINNLKEFVEYARREKKASFGTFAAGSTAHAVAVELNLEYGLNIEPVHYRGEAPMAVDFGAQVLDAAMGSHNGARSLIETGRAKPIAVTSRARLPELPDVPTFMEQGSKSLTFQIVGYVCFVAPVGTPKAILQQLSDAVMVGTTDPKVRQAMKTLGYHAMPLDMVAAQKLYSDEGPYWIEMTKRLKLTPM